jgi:hypothetical protein
MKTATANQKERHGLSRSPEYRAWQGMIDRCVNPNNQRYHRYGGRGISVCQKWTDSFAAFYADVGPRPSPKHSLDREKNDGGYEPGNVRWVLGDVQVRNTCRNIFIEYGGRRLTLMDWSNETGINYYTLMHRERRGISPAEILSPLPRHRGRRRSGQ